MDADLLGQPRLPPLDDAWLRARGELVGEGATSQVWRLPDPRLGRSLVVKVLRPELAGDGAAARRLRVEARVTARLQHPGVVPVIDAGELPDGRPWFAMQEVRGRTLECVLADRPRPSLRRLVEVLHRASEAVACAHEAGVVHRDLKPVNLLVGPHGEVRVLDWGLALVDGEDPYGLGEAVVGSAAFMAPEQARGDPDPGPPTDVHALGAILYLLLTGRPPYEGRDWRAAWRAVLQGSLVPPAERVPGVPADLDAICREALARRPEDRPPDGRAFADRLGAWLAGELQRRRAIAMVRRAQADLDRCRSTRQDALKARALADEVLAAVPPGGPPEARVEGWALEDEAQRLEEVAELLEEEAVQALQTALTLDPQLDAAHRLLAAHYRRRHEQAERRRDHALAARLAVRVQAHDRGEHAAWLRGVGSLSLASDPPGARVRIAPHVRLERRLVPGDWRELGVTPLQRVELPAGSYLVELAHPGRLPVRVPVRLERLAHWTGNAEGVTEPLVVELPPAGSLPEGVVVVPAGPAILGGDPRAPGSEGWRERWLAAFAIDRDPVTLGAYLAFLNALVEAGHGTEALRLAPAVRGRPLPTLDAGGRFVLEAMDPCIPVTCVDGRGAVAYARWRAARAGRPCRLPTEWEWEKAARGADGRSFPWGDAFDPSLCAMRDTDPALAGPEPVGGRPLDQGPLGVRGMAGNVREWCLEAPEADRPRVVRGGGWLDDAANCRAAARRWLDPESGYPFVGFRLVWPLGGGGPRPGAP